MFERLLFLCFVFFLCLSCLYVLSHFYLFSVLNFNFHTPSIKPKAHPPNEEYCPVAIYNPLTSYEPNQLDNFDYSEASAAIFQDESVDIDTELSYSCDAELDDELIGKALSSPLFIQEREEPANLRQTYHSHEESLLPAQSFFAHSRTQRPVHELSSCGQKPSGKMENERIRILLERQKEQILAEVGTEIQKHEFQADSDRRSIQELTGIIDSQRREIDHTISIDEQLRRDQLLLQEQLSEQNRDLREVHIKSLHGMEELKRVQELRIDEFSGRRLIENQDIIHEITARIQELQNEVNCMNDSRDLKDAESVRSGQSHVTSQPALFPPHRDPGGLLSRKDKPPDIWDTHGISGNVFVNPPASSLSHYPGGFKTEVCTCSQFPTEAMLWIKEVEMVESVDDLKSSRSVKGTPGPDFELLDARIASALNKMFQNTRFKKKVSLEEQKAHKEDRFLRERQIAYLIYEYSLVTGVHDSVDNFADLFTVALRNDDIQEFDSKWDEILLSMTQIPSDDILESFYKLRIRESEKLKTVLDLYSVEIHQKKAEPDSHRLKTMVKRSIEQNLRMKNSEARNGNYERNAVVKKSGDKTA